MTRTHKLRCRVVPLYASVSPSAGSWGGGSHRLVQKEANGQTEKPGYTLLENLKRRDSWNKEDFSKGRTSMAAASGPPLKKKGLETKRNSGRDKPRLKAACTHPDMDRIRGQNRSAGGAVKDLSKRWQSYHRGDVFSEKQSAEDTNEEKRRTISTRGPKRKKHSRGPETYTLGPPPGLSKRGAAARSRSLQRGYQYSTIEKCSRSPLWLIESQPSGLVVVSCHERRGAGRKPWRSPPTEMKNPIGISGRPVDVSNRSLEKNGARGQR